MMDQEKRGRRCRKKHLTPLSEMTPAQIVLHIEALNLTKLRLLLRAMNSCTTANCWWVEYDIAKRYGVDVSKAIRYKESKRQTQNKGVEG